MPAPRAGPCKKGPPDARAPAAAVHCQLQDLRHRPGVVELVLQPQMEDANDGARLLIDQETVPIFGQLGQIDRRKRLPWKGPLLQLAEQVIDRLAVLPASFPQHGAPPFRPVQYTIAGRPLQDRRAGIAKCKISCKNRKFFLQN